MPQRLLLKAWHHLPAGSTDPAPALVAAAKNADGQFRTAIVAALGLYPSDATTDLLAGAVTSGAPTDDKRNGTRLLIEMALTAAPEAVADSLGLFVRNADRKKRTTYRHLSTLSAVIAHPSFPVAQNQAAFTDDVG